MPSFQGSTAALGLYINSGSIYESPENAGASHLLEYLAFRTTQHRYLRRIRPDENRPLTLDTAAASAYEAQGGLNVLANAGSAGRFCVPLIHTLVRFNKSPSTPPTLPLL